MISCCFMFFFIVSEPEPGTGGGGFVQQDAEAGSWEILLPRLVNTKPDSHFPPSNPILSSVFISSGDSFRYINQCIYIMFYILVV